MSTEIIYGVHTGCIYEGGGMGDLYKTKEGAIKAALHFLKEAEAQHERMYKKDKEMKASYAWRKCANTEYRWHNTVDEICVVERKLYP